MDRIIASTSESVKGHNKFIHFYCVKCRDHFKSKIYEEVKFKNGKNALKCKCDKCEVPSYLIVKNI
jgi:NAD-dependent SIR2 family protein deacetylase